MSDDQTDEISLCRAYNNVICHATTYEHKLKCLRCGLHFVVYSWDPKWPVITQEEARRLLAEQLAGNGFKAYGTFRETPVCPQCGNARRKGTAFLHMVSVSEDPIYKLHAGDDRWLWIDGERREVHIKHIEVPLDDLTP